MRKKTLFYRALSLSLALAVASPIASVSACGKTSLHNKIQAKARIQAMEASVDSNQKVQEVCDYITDIIGIQSLDNELVFEQAEDKAFTSTYTFKQYYKGVEVINQGVKVVVDKNTGNVEWFTSYYEPNISIDVNASVSKETAIATVKADFPDIGIAKASLVIAQDGQKKVLNWRIETTDDTITEINVNANDGYIGALQRIESSSIEGDEAIQFDVVNNQNEPGYNTNLFQEAKEAGQGDFAPTFGDKNFKVDLVKNGSVYGYYDINRKIYFVSSDKGLAGCAMAAEKTIQVP